MAADRSADGDTVEESLVAIDMFDARTGKAIWSGIGATPAQLTANDRQTIDDVVAEILRDFPPAPSSSFLPGHGWVRA